MWLNIIKIIEKKINLKKSALQRKRFASKLHRTPSWADLKKIVLVYIEAAYLTKETGVKYVVDHIIPLQGKLVSGLHVDNNLQVITQKENNIKKNKYNI